MFRRLLRLLLLLLLCGLAATARAHEMPSDARLNVFVVPQGRTLSVLVRAPLGSMPDIDYPMAPGNTVLVSKADPALRNAVAVWLLPAIGVFEDGAALPPPRVAAVRMALPSDRSFASWETARAGIDAPKLADGLGLYWSQQFIDVLLEYPIASDRSRFAVDLRVDRFGETVATALRLVQGPAIRAFALHGNAGRVDLDPGWWEAATRFVREGVWHILGGTDHLLFLACLVIPFRRLRALVAIVTAFTVAHSISLVASALGLAPDVLWFPPLVEVLIAASILYMALENVIGVTVQRRWVLTFAFGLVHGFGFSFGLRETMQFAGDHLLLSLLAFNLGVEAGQVLVLLALVPLLQFVLPRLPSERAGVIVLSALIAHVAWHWLAERWGELAKFPWPKPDVLLLTGAMQALALLLALGGLVWAVSGAMNRWLARPEADQARDQGA